MSEQVTLSEGRTRELAVRANVHPRTITKVLRGLPVRGMPGDRARAVLEAEGLLPKPVA